MHGEDQSREKTIAPFELGPQAFAYLRSQLAQGGPLTSTISLSSGDKVWAYVPFGATSHQELDDFESGGVFSAEDANDILQHVIHFIAEF